MSGVKQLVKKNYSNDELISARILLQEVAEEDYLRECHHVGSRQDKNENPELAALAAGLSPFAFDLVNAEFTYATSGHADYQLDIGNDAVVLKSRRTGDTHL
ncbi:hypothetical protein PHMEG_00010302 [Phytophthora megakarya]|uniref:Uncharacterized protein n=1 Tax=Phytophthora megakarya TaxID=4795 RepID=A0A225WED1_9STRA|nr:hypothetical protein PHMEG_00010302 [Phytophthora megakarya]